MMDTTVVRRGAAVGVLLAAGGCGIVGPSCLDRQQTGRVTTVSGQIAAGQIVAHLVPYDTRGSQNDGRISYSAQGTAGGPRLQVYATLASCVDFIAPTPQQPDVNGGNCRPIAQAGGYPGPDGGLVPTTITVTGPGNGAPAGFHEYKLFVVGDPAQPASYAITVSYFFGPDC